MLKKVILGVGLVFSLTANASYTPTSEILKDEGNYFTDTTTYVDWLKFDSTSRSQELSAEKGMANCQF